LAAAGQQQQVVILCPHSAKGQAGPRALLQDGCSHAPLHLLFSIERNRSIIPINAAVICVMSEASPTSSAAGAKMRSPRIMALAWGKLEVEGAGTFRDAKLFPGGVREWDWRETGTEHTPGIQPADVRELLDHGATTIVLSQGMLKRLGICPETLELLKRQGVSVHVLPTEDAVSLYNDLRKTEQVAGLFHTTC
jgi:hypothetical protein